MYTKSISTIMVMLTLISGCKPKPAPTPQEKPAEQTESKVVSIIAPFAQIGKLAGEFKFTEGPAVDSKGNVYYTDIPNNNIMKHSIEGKSVVFISDSGGANGLYFDDKDNLLICEGGRRQVTMVTPGGDTKVLADKYQGKKFNSPNDLWLDGKGGIYFTDPRYGNRDNMEMEGEHVYYITPSGEKVIRVIDDMVRPNGLIGTPDGKTLYVTDHGGGKTFQYSINEDGTLSEKTLFVERGSDGMAIDEKGNIYLTTDAVEVYSPEGKLVEKIEIPERPANVTFGGKDNKMLFVTARTSLYAIRMNVTGR